jgi:hypothetical protein
LCDRPAGVVPVGDPDRSMHGHQPHETQDRRSALIVQYVEFLPEGCSRAARVGAVVAALQASKMDSHHLSCLSRGLAALLPLVGAI